MFPALFALLQMAALRLAWQPSRAAANDPSPHFWSAAESSVTNATGDSITINGPSDTVIGDLLIAAIVHAPDGDLTAPTRDRKPIDFGQCEAAACALGVWYLVAGVSELLDYTFTWTAPKGANKAAGAIPRYTDADPSNPIDVIA